MGSVTVTAFDADRRPICDLHAADFVLRIDGREVPITNFGGCAPPGTQAAATPAPAEPTTTPTEADRQHGTAWVVVVDQGNISVFSRREVLLRLATFVRKRVRPPDRIAVLVLSNRLEVACQMTSEPDAALRAIESLSARTAGVGTSGAIVRMGETQIRTIWEEPGAMKLDRMMMTARAAAGRVRDILRSTCGTLERLIRSLAGVEGRKALIYVSDGLPMQPARELFVLVTEFFPTTTPAQGGADSFRADDLFVALGDFAAAAGVELYPIDALGVHNAGGFEAERRERLSNDVATLGRYNNQQTLSYLAGRTGGTAVLNTNDFVGALEEIADAAMSSYSLGFPLEGLEPDKPLRVDVAVRGERKVRLRYRPVFVGRRPETVVADRTSAGLLFGSTDNALGVSVSAQHPQSDGKGRCSVPLAIRLPLASLALPPEGDILAGAVLVFYQAGDAEGHRSPLARSHHAIPLAANHLTAPGVLAINTEAEVGAGESRVSVGVLDEVSGQSGFATTTVRCDPGR